ncbi:MAG: hypothetical protein Unbinned585contig1001_27 [Prokaryotic dsDNA virus sp.]|nr:MAG: hypothetical protein Unbinned585contig1001_27 [Prokaryotic dsDNA virus sp.]|tara:strand:+ start:608 stop:1189 length:582 start_codon:yes stop_codon:yes gene_type:complete
MAIQHTLYISASRLKKDTALGGSVDDNLIMPYILLAQDMNILPILGTDLDAKLKTEIQADTLSGVYKTLVETYIQPALVQFAFSTLAPYLRLRFSNNSVVVMGATEQSSSATYDDIKPLMDTATDAAEFYRQRCIDYLRDNTSSFPEYSSNTGSDLDPTTRNYYAGINLDSNVPRSNRLKSFLQGADITIYGC